MPLPFESEGQDLGWLVANRYLRVAAFAGARERGIELLCGQRVSGFTRSDAMAELCTESGERHAAPLVVAADSRFSPLRRLAGIGGRGTATSGAVRCWCRARAAARGPGAECFLQGHTSPCCPCQTSAARRYGRWPTTLPGIAAMDDAELAATIRGPAAAA